jgi:putative transposase
VKKSRFTEEQIAYALKQAELGTPVAEVCCKMGIPSAANHQSASKVLFLCHHGLSACVHSDT